MVGNDAMSHSFHDDSDDIIPGNLITAGHGEQPLPLQDSVPRLDGVTGADRDGSFARLDLSAQLSSGFSVRVSVSLICSKNTTRRDTHSRLHHQYHKAPFPG